MHLHLRGHRLAGHAAEWCAASAASRVDCARRGSVTSSPPPLLHLILTVPPPPSGTGQAAYLYNLNLEVQRTQQGAKISGVGARCPTSGNYETTILFICKEQGAKEKPVNTVLDAANCKATFEFETVVACGGKPPAKKKAKSLDVGMLLCLLFFIPFIIYFAAGAGCVRAGVGRRDAWLHAGGDGQAQRRTCSHLD